MSIRDMTKDDVLEAMGLQPRKSAMDLVLPAAGLFATGILVGVGLGMMFAPKPGSDLRRDIGHKFSHMRGEAETTAKEAFPT